MFQPLFPVSSSVYSIAGAADEEKRVKQPGMHLAKIKTHWSVDFFSFLCGGLWAICYSHVPSPAVKGWLGIIQKVVHYKRPSRGVVCMTLLQWALHVT